MNNLAKTNSPELGILGLYLMVGNPGYISESPEDFLKHAGTWVPQWAVRISDSGVPY